jgi:hypothetical protein
VPDDFSAFAAKVVLNLVVIARKVKSQHTLLRLKNQPPRQPGAALVKRFAEFADRQPGVSVWIAKTLQDELQCRGHFIFPSGFPHDFFEPLGQFNGNHFCSR